MGNSDSALAKKIDKGKNVSDREKEETADEMVERLEKDIETLSARCARLEAQNILVPVQQLDMLARGTAVLLSALSYYYYWKCLCWAVAQLPVTVETLLPILDGQEWMDYVLHPLSLTMLKCIWAVVPYLYNHVTYGSAHRRFEVFAVAFIVIARVKMSRWRERMFMVDPAFGVSKYGHDTNEDAIWDANYEISARFLYVSILRLRGLWTKSAQYLSSRADFMPESYVRELKKLQDEAPMTEWKDVQRMLAKAPGLIKELTDISEIPIASASIGQVHTARVRSTGEKVVFKVQHPHARTLLMDDFWSLRVIARLVTWMDPEYAFFEILMKEWAVEARKELDFLTEADNLKAAQASIDMLLENKKAVVYSNPTPKCQQAVPFQVEIPRPILHLTTNDVLVMSFCEGTRVDDLEQIQKWGLQREAVMDGVAQTFSHMMYATSPSIFNADPHPGNIFVHPGTRASKTEGFTIVLLDWGLAKRMPEEKRVAFCQMAYAASTFDYGMLLDAFRRIGLKMKRENVAEDMESMRFYLRDMAPSSKQRKRIKAKIKTDRDRRNAKKKGERVPMESKAYPGEFFFFVRVNELLHGLGSKLHVEMSYLDAIKPYAERGLAISDMYSVKGDVRSSFELAHTDEKLSKQVNTVLRDLKRKSLIAGAQVCVLDSEGRVVANVCEGHMGGLKKRIPMRPDALILGYSCTKAVATTMAHILVQDGYLSYDEPVYERVWKAFCPTKEPPRELQQALNISPQLLEERWTWKRQITLRHILTHASGLWSALPAELTIKTMASCETCCAAFEYNSSSPQATILPTRKPGEKSEYHFMSFGWLVAGALCGAYSIRHDKTFTTFEEVYDAVLKPKLSPRTLQLGFRPCGGTGEFPVAITETADISLSSLLQKRREAEAVGEGSDDAVHTAFAEIRETFRGKEFLLDPRIWNCEEALQANVPSAGGRFSAMGLAHFYHDLGAGRVVDRDILRSASMEVTKENTANALQGQTAMASNNEREGVSFGLGYQLIRFDGDTGQPAAFGHAGVGGSIGFHHKDSGVSIGIMLNKADGDKDTAKTIVRTISNHYSW